MTPRARRGHLLLVDLDGVLVARTDDVSVTYPVLADARAWLESLGMPWAVVTHRSREEARGIVSWLELGEVEVHAAESAWLRALQDDSVAELLRAGVRKGVLLASVADARSLEACDVAWLDDRRDVLEDALRRGLGLALLAPAARTPTPGRVVAFDPAAVARELRAWAGMRSHPAALPDAGRLVELPAVERAVAGDAIRVPTDPGVFGALRRFARTLRSLRRRSTMNGRAPVQGGDVRASDRPPST